MEKQHDNAIDLIKFIAVLFITNSHFLPLYKDINPALATFGVHGNALFFFASGLTIAKSDSVVKLDFFNWYKRRIGRIWPVLIVNSLLVNILQLGGKLEDATIRRGILVLAVYFIGLCDSLFFTSPIKRIFICDVNSLCGSYMGWNNTISVDRTVCLA